MDHSLKTGLSFGLTSDIITTLGLRARAWKIIGEHVAIALLVILVTHYIGDWVTDVFG